MIDTTGGETVLALVAVCPASVSSHILASMLVLRLCCNASNVSPPWPSLLRHAVHGSHFTARLLVMIYGNTRHSCGGCSGDVINFECTFKWLDASPAPKPAVQSNLREKFCRLARVDCGTSKHTMHC